MSYVDRPAADQTHAEHKEISAMDLAEALGWPTVLKVRAFLFWAREVNSRASGPEDTRVSGNQDRTNQTGKAMLSPVTECLFVPC